MRTSRRELPDFFMIKVDNLAKSFGNVKAVDGISFEIKKGDIVGFLGLNGAGKTTTLRLIAGFLSPDKGQIKINGLDTQTQAVETQKLIGYMPENNPLYKDMLVSEFLDLCAQLSGVTKQQRPAAFEFVVKAAAITDVFYRPVGELSKGYKQRIGLAAALLHKPQILILDEPTEGLDPNQRAEIRSLIEDLARDRTIIMSTHVMQEAQAICNRLIIINQGKIIADGTREELSRSIDQNKILILEVQGQGIELALSKIGDVDRVDVRQLDNDRILAKITVKEPHEIRPEISRLATAKGWVIWRLQEEERKLEDIFHKLTCQ
jgi:ABC-2 type transport system ATP-binding protein